MRDRPRKSLALTASVVLHLAPLVWALISFAPKLDLELEIELDDIVLVDPDALQGAEPEKPKPIDVPVPPPVPTSTPAPGPEPAPPKPEPPKPEPPKDEHDLGKQHTKADQLGPTNSSFYGLLVPKKIRKLSFAEKALDVMAPLPDFEYLITGGGFDALRDFDHIVIASPEIRDPLQTFLAVDYRVTREEVQRSIERAAAKEGEGIEWIEEGGIIRGNPRPLDENEPDTDPRFFVLLEDKVAVFVRPEYLKHILADEVGTEETAGNYVANLAKLKKFAATQPTAGLQVVLKKFRNAVKRAKLPFAVPDTLELSAEAAEEPEVSVRGEFPTVVDAKAFQNWWSDEVPGMIPTAAKFWIMPIYDQIVLTRNGAAVQLWARFTTKQADFVLSGIADVHAKAVHKTAEEIAEAKRLRKENWLKRKNGKLPPSVLDGKAAGGAAAEGGTKPPSPATPPKGPAPSEPAPSEPAPGEPAPSEPAPSEPAKTPT